MHRVIRIFAAVIFCEFTNFFLYLWKLFYIYRLPIYTELVNPLTRIIFSQIYHKSNIYKNGAFWKRWHHLLNLCMHIIALYTEQTLETTTIMSDYRFAYILFALLSFMASLHLNLLKVAAPLHRQTEASATPNVLSTFFVNGLKSATNNYFIQSPLNISFWKVSVNM